MVKRTAFSMPTPSNRSTRRSRGRSAAYLSKAKTKNRKSMTIDEILRSGAKIKTKFGITTKEVASILKHRHDMGKIREILSPIAGAATMEAVQQLAHK